MKKLEVGCGANKRAEYLGMDIVPLEGVDVVYDMNTPDWPFEDNTFSEIVFDDVLEHSKDLFTILKEIYRVAEDRALIKISVPHFSCDNMYTDPTHTIFYSSRSFNLFDKSLNHKHGFYLPEVNFKVEKNYISFMEYFTHDGKRPFNPFRLIGFEFLVNHFKRIYERFFCWIIPAGELYFELRVIKNE